MKINKLTLIIATLLLPTVLLAQDKIKIGVAVPLSGGAASYGTDIKNALLFANKKIAGNAYQLIIEDDQCSDKMAVTVAQKLTRIDQVDYMLGFGCSGTVLSSAPIYNKSQTIVIASGTGAPDITDAGDYIFRTKPSLKVAGQKLYQDMSAKFKKVGLITEETAYCQGLSDSVIKSNQKDSLTIYNENFLSNVNDFRTTLLKLKNKGVEALFLNTQTENTLINLYKQLLALKWEIQVYGTFHPGSTAFLKAFGTKADGILYADTPFNYQMLNQKGLEVFDEFIQEYGPTKSSEHFATLSYAAFSSLHDAILSEQDVKSYLYKTKFQNIIDGYSFDQNGDVVSDKITYVLKEIKTGKPVAYNLKQ